MIAISAKELRLAMSDARRGRAESPLTEYLQAVDAVLPVQVAPPVRVAGARWWPDLYLKKGRTLQQVTPAQASAVASAIRERLMNDGKGASSFNPVKLYTDSGFRCGFAAWNGTVWLEDEESGNHTEIPT